MLRRIIPCLDVKDGRVVKGTKFLNLRDAGDPVELARHYDEEGADELVFLDISATVEGRKTMVELVRETSRAVSIPLTVGGGIRSLEDVRTILSAGADKVSISTAAVQEPELISRAADEFGSSSIVVAIDVKEAAPGRWEVVTHGGQKGTGLDVLAWAEKAASLGAGEILLTSMDRTEQRTAATTSSTRAVASSVDIPVIASGGQGLWSIFGRGCRGGAEGLLAASMFHFGHYTIREAKEYLWAGSR